jgi:SAM-dependent methyltransferase
LSADRNRNVAQSDSVERELEHAAALEYPDPQQAAKLYAALLDRAPGCVAASNALERLKDPRRFSAWMRVNCMIHPADDLLRFIARSPHGQNPIRAYLADGWRTLSELMLLLERLERPLLGFDSVLEFACGYGRFTRHLSRALPGRVDASDILPGSIEFVHQQFAVGTFPSAFEPEQIEFPRRYGLVFVLSLFTHLPIEDWGRWLRSLAGAVAPGGWLLFSVHSEAMARSQNVCLADNGVFFAARSESPSLDPARYGTIYTTRAVVEDQIRSALGNVSVQFADEVFWLGQDAVIVSPGPVSED